MFLPVVDVDVLCIMRSYVDIRPYDLFNRLFSTFDVEEKKSSSGMVRSGGRFRCFWSF